MHTKKESTASRMGIRLMGDKGVGASSLINRFVDSAFAGEGKEIRDRDVSGHRTCQINKNDISVQVWDKSKETGDIRNMRAQNFSNIMLLVDVTKEEAVNNLKHHLSDIKMYYPEAIITVVGTKSDLPHIVTREDVEGMMKHYGKDLKFGGYVETSSKNGEGVERAFETAAKARLKAASPSEEAEHREIQEHEATIKKYKASTQEAKAAVQQLKGLAEKDEWDLIDEEDAKPSP